MKKIFSLNKKILFAVLSILSVVGYGVLVFAAAPNGGYAPGTTLDPDCAPGDTDCVVSIGGLNPNSILYTNANGNTTTDSSFTRNTTNYETYIGRTYQNTLPGDFTLTLDPLIAEFSPDPTPAAFVPGEQLTFEDTNTNTTYTGVYSEFMYSINQPDVDANTTFNGSGINDLNASANSGYSGPVPTTFTITIIEKDLSIYGRPSVYNGNFQIGETVIGSNSGATGTVVSTVHGLVLDNITGIFQLYEDITGNSSGANVNNDVNGNTVDVFSYDNGDVSGIGIAGYGSIEIYGNSLYFNMNNSTGHEIGDQWTVDVTSTPFYIHIHKVSNINTSVQEDHQLSVTGQTSNISIQAGLYAVTPLGAPGDQIIFQNFSGPTPTIDGIGAITAVNGNNYGIQIQQGTYHVGDLAFIDNQNGEDPLALVSAGNTDPIIVDMSSGFSINSNILGAGLRGSVFQQTDGTITGVMGALDTSSVGGQSVTLGSNISSTATNATSFTSQTIDEIIQTVEMNSGDKSILSLTGNQFKLSSTYTVDPDPSIEVGFMSTSYHDEMYPAWFVGGNIQILPKDLGSSGQVLTTDGTGNLSWAASSGGSSPISINGSTLYSSGLANTGSYSNSNIFLGDSAGYNATSASYSNFIGYNAGNGATNVSNSNFLGQSAGNGATSAYYSNFLGPNAGYYATSAYYSNFLGSNAGNGATNASFSNFLGNEAGNGATGASNSNFLGYYAGNGATNASFSNFLGQSAGNGATNASGSNFLGQSAGNGATNASYSNFLGTQAGNGATNAYQSNFLGLNAGNGATGASNSNFLGYYAGINATNASGSNFLGQSAGNGATNASYSNFLGQSAGNGATNASYSNFLGYYAGNGATNASNSNFLGPNAGHSATSASYSNFIGYNAGNGATSAYQSNFLGLNAGNGATNASFSNFLGSNAGNGATNASFSNFLGNEAGNGATNASNSNFLGPNAGHSATSASYSNFIGYNAGNGATSAYQSNFLGLNAGNGATNASNSTFIGKSAGNNDLVNNTGSPDDFSILIGPNTSTGNNGSGVGYSNSIALGGYATNTASNQFMIGSTTRPINQIVMVASGGTTCATDINGTACSSDERLKTNITDLTTGILDKVVNTKTVTFNWNNNTDTTSHIGFIAQDIQQYFPELVSTGSTGYLSVNYAGMAPVLVQAIREMNLKITTINDMATPNTWRDSLIAWFGNVGNGITKMFANEVETKNLCVSDDTGGKTCITKAQLDQLLNNAVGGSIAPSPSPDPDPILDPGTGGDTVGGDSTTGGDVPTDTSPSSGDTPTDTPTPSSDPGPTDQVQ